MRLTDLQLIDLQVRALFTHDANSNMLLVNEPGGTAAAPAPRMFLGRTRKGNLCRFRHDLPEKIVKALSDLCADEPVVANFEDSPRHANEYLRLLEADSPVVSIEAGPVYYFNELAEPRNEHHRPPMRMYVLGEKDTKLLAGGFEDFIAELATWQPFVALLEGDRAVSVCRSVRITQEAHEAGVETLPDFRGKGYARKVTARWARLVIAAGAVPLYSTSWENIASQSVARGLNLSLFGSDFHVT